MRTVHELWQSVCQQLNVEQLSAEQQWHQLVECSPPNTVWHSLDNCVLYQAVLWDNMEAQCGGTVGARGALFKLALLMRHVPPDKITMITTKVLPDTPDKASQCAYLEALLLENEPSDDATTVFERDLRLFQDLELSVMCAPMDVYMSHTELVRAEYPNLADQHYLGLRLKVLESFTQIPMLYKSAEFSAQETIARDNIQVEVKAIREKLRTH